MTEGDGIEDGITKGRQFYMNGEYKKAEICWRNCLKDAYANEYHAATFVLSKNLGDVSPKRSDAVEFYEYALEIAASCGVIREQSLRSSIAMIAIAMQKLADEYPCSQCNSNEFRVRQVQSNWICFPCYDQTSLKRIGCTTCTLSFDITELIQDTDEQFYCNPCYESYYEEEETEEQDILVADDGMLCAACLDADGTIRDWRGLFYCQSCFIKQNQSIPDDLQIQSPRQIHQDVIQVEKETEIPATVSVRLVYSVPFLLSLRHKSPSPCPGSIRESPVHVKLKSSSPKSKNSRASVEPEVEDKVPSMSKSAFEQHVIGWDEATSNAHRSFFKANE